ncbi:MAG: hypothetical protein EX271_09155 [Acidimicrobiales bacterium]|nr:hypothetical protein [Hyphomonadaceae bacterium]RZV40920.1 MAG: hypothetical protein EX271_09155 [Acidimicrobiales bacterium]
MKQFFAISLSSLLLTACASTGETKQKANTVKTKAAGLSEQNLVEGECAIFLWAANGKREFVYFQKQDSATAKYYKDDTTIDIATTDNTSALADTPALNFSYTGPSSEKITVSGGYDGEIEGGLKIAPSTIKVETKDGWQQITPASGVFACL